MNIIKQGISGQNIEQQGSMSFLESLGIPKSNGVGAPVFASSQCQIRQNSTTGILEAWDIPSDSWIPFGMPFEKLALASMINTSDPDKIIYVSNDDTPNGDGGPGIFFLINNQIQTPAVISI